MESLIAESIVEDRIVHADYSPELAADLAAAADDWMENGPVVEYWGVDDAGSGSAWRVHLDRTADDEVRS